MMAAACETTLSTRPTAEMDAKKLSIVFTFSLKRDRGPAAANTSDRRPVLHCRVIGPIILIHQTERCRPTIARAMHRQRAFIGKILFSDNGVKVALLDTCPAIGGPRQPVSNNAV
jgi:hypothetical protein